MLLSLQGKIVKQALFCTQSTSDILIYELRMQ